MKAPALQQLLGWVGPSVSSKPPELETRAGRQSTVSQMLLPLPAPHGNPDMVSCARGSSANSRGCPPPEISAGSVPGFDPAQMRSHHPPSSLPPCRVPTPTSSPHHPCGLQLLGTHVPSLSPQGIKVSYLPPCGPPALPDSKALLPTSTGLRSSPVPCGAAGFVLLQWGMAGRRREAAETLQGCTRR